MSKELLKAIFKKQTLHETFFNLQFRCEEVTISPISKRSRKMTKINPTRVLVTTFDLFHRGGWWWVVVGGAIV